MTFSKAVLITSFPCLLLAPAAARAQPPFELDSTHEWVTVGIGAALSVVGWTLTAGVEPLTIDEINRLDVNDVNSFDRESIHEFRPDHAGDALVSISYLMPFSLLAYDETREDWKTLGVMWTEATLLNLGINQVVKATVLRTRPYVYDPDTPIDKKTRTNARLSFYSGHTSSAATNCFFMARVLTEYVDDRPAELALWTGAALYPALTGFLRRDSGHHFTTDVMVGYVVGAAIGYLVPELHRRDDERVSLQPASGAALGFSVQVAF